MVPQASAKAAAAEVAEAFAVESTCIAGNTNCKLGVGLPSEPPLSKNSVGLPKSLPLDSWVLKITTGNNLLFDFTALSHIDETVDCVKLREPQAAGAPASAAVTSPLVLALLGFLDDLRDEADGDRGGFSCSDR